jgi:undecaprenyl-diphosphatase
VTWWETIILGIVQGLTEFLPISSSAHIRIVGELLPSGADPGAAFTAITQLGTEAAVVVYFRKDIARIISHWVQALPFGPWKRRLPASDPDARMGWFVIVGSIPIVVLGLVLETWIDPTFRPLVITAAMLAGFAVLLLVADRTGRQTKDLADVGWSDAILMGFAQALALVPGVSRSGGTITMGLFLGLKRAAAARISFLLAVPAVLGSGLYKLFSDVLLSDAEPLPGEPSLAATFLATVVAFVVGYAVISWFLKFVETRTYIPFVVYRIILAVVVVGLVLGGALSATS